jgi:vacuolar-type H+-ATPase subunit I/STV1
MPDSTVTENAVNPFGEKVFYSYEMGDYVLLVALVIGLLIVLIGYFFAGGKNNRTVLIFSIIISSLVGILILPGLFKIAASLKMDSPYIHTGLIIFDLVFVAIISCHAYELVTVTAKEAHPD